MFLRAAAVCETNELSSILALTALKHVNWHDKLCVKNAASCLLLYLTRAQGLDFSCKLIETSSDHLLAEAVIS